MKLSLAMDIKNINGMTHWTKVFTKFFKCVVFSIFTFLRHKWCGRLLRPLIWVRIKGLKSRRNFDWTGNWSGRRTCTPASATPVPGYTRYTFSNSCTPAPSSIQAALPLPGYTRQGTRGRSHVLWHSCLPRNRGARGIQEQPYPGTLVYPSAYGVGV